MMTGPYTANQNTQTTYLNEDLETIYDLGQESQRSVERIARNRQPKSIVTIHKHYSPVNGNQGTITPHKPKIYMQYTKMKI